MIDPRLVDELENMVDHIGFKPRITSGVRLPSTNARVGGVSSSSHLPKATKDDDTPKVRGVDIAVRRSQDRYRIINFMLYRKFTRIGVYNAHIHLDIDPALPQEVIWVGKSK